MNRVEEICTITYRIELMGEIHDLTEEEFWDLQEECREIADYGEEREETPQKNILDIAWEYIKTAKVYKSETPDGTTQLECPKCHHECHHPHCWNCGQKLDGED